ncbi:MAG: helicase [Verrucomicrobiales bacterium]|nr:helicase [Verrucomicrobiales bacterium]
MPFEGLGLDAKILQAVKETGYTEPTPIQVAAIPPIVAGHDLIGIAQTGTGKTAAFTLPILTRLAAQPQSQRRTRVLVLAPTRELVVQIDENVRAYGKHLPLSVATIFGGVGEQPQIRALRAGTDIIVACPGRLLDLMRRRCADFSQLKALVLDEADRMLDMGFLPDIKSIVQQLPKERQTLMFSATLSKEIERLTHDFQRNPKMVQIGRRSNPAETVTQLVYEVTKGAKTSLLLHLLREPQMNMVLIFSRMKHAADRLARQLEQSGIRTATLHSNRSQSQRLRALKDFKSGAVRVLVATDIAARGIDVDGISHVINYDFPMHVEDYVHRIGRTGRANAIGDAISFVTPEDHGELRAVERFIGRGIIRKRAEGFNYSATQPRETTEDDRRPRHQQGGRRPQGQQRQHAQPRHDSQQGQQGQQRAEGQQGQGGQQQRSGPPRSQGGGGQRPSRPSGQRRWGR